MATHQQNIDNLQNAVYGNQVRGSMIELFEEDYTLVKKALSVGTDIKKSDDSTVGYTEGNLYLNTDTMDLWRNEGDGWVIVGNINSIESVNVVESSMDDGYNVITMNLTGGEPVVFSIKNGKTGATGRTGTSVTGVVDNGDGSFYLTLSNGTTTDSVKTIQGLEGKTGPQGRTGDTGAAGRSVTRFEMGQQGKIHPVTAYFSDDSYQVLGNLQDGADGSGTGDMVKATYDKNDNGIVDAAESISDGSTTLTLQTLFNKADKSTTLDGYGITNAYTKTEVDEMISEISGSTWNDIESKPFSTIDNAQFKVENDKLKIQDIYASKNIYGTVTEWNASTLYKIGDYVTYLNKLYRCVIQNSGEIPEGDEHWNVVDLVSMQNSISKNQEKQLFDFKESLLSASAITSVNTAYCKKVGNICFVTIMFRCSSDITSGSISVSIPRPFVEAGVEYSSPLASRDGKTGFFTVSSNGAINIRCAASSSQWLVGNLCYYTEE